MKSADDKKTREAQAAAYKAAGWRLVIRPNERGGGAARMERNAQ
mgnify:CR=1 FL=1